jgi:outer membrane protein
MMKISRGLKKRVGQLRQCRLFLAVLMLLLGTDLAFSQDINVALVDVVGAQDYLLSKVDVQLKDEFKKRHIDLTKMASEMQKGQEKLQKDASMMSKTESSKLQVRLEGDQREYQRLVQAFEEDLNARRRDEMQKHIEKLVAIVEQISHERHYDMVLAKNAALFVDKKYDITEEVLKKYEESK